MANDRAYNVARSVTGGYAGLNQSQKDLLRDSVTRAIRREVKRELDAAEDRVARLLSSNPNASDDEIYLAIRARSKP